MNCYCRFLLLLSAVILMNGCHRLITWFCGELSAEQSAISESVYKEFNGQAVIEFIPCEYSDLNIRLRADLDSTQLISLAKYLNAVNSLSYCCADVYDKNGRYLCYISIGAGKVRERHYRIAE